MGFDYIKKLHFEDKPDYKLLISYFDRILHPHHKSLHNARINATITNISK